MWSITNALLKDYAGIFRLCRTGAPSHMVIHILNLLHWISNFVLLLVCWSSLCHLELPPRKHSSPSRAARNLRRGQLRRLHNRESLSDPAVVGNASVAAEFLHASGQIEASASGQIVADTVIGESPSHDLHVTASGQIDVNMVVTASGQIDVNNFEKSCNDSTAHTMLSVEDLFALLTKEKDTPASNTTVNSIIPDLLVRVSQLTARLVDSKGGYSPDTQLKGRQRDPLPLPELAAAQCKRCVPLSPVMLDLIHFLAG